MLFKDKFLQGNLTGGPVTHTGVVFFDLVALILAKH